MTSSVEFMMVVTHTAELFNGLKGVERRLYYGLNGVERRLYYSKSLDRFYYEIF